jgi:hypothetical protein
MRKLERELLKAEKKPDLVGKASRFEYGRMYAECESTAYGAKLGDIAYLLFLAIPNMLYTIAEFEKKLKAARKKLRAGCSVCGHVEGR